MCCPISSPWKIPLIVCRPLFRFNTVNGLSFELDIGIYLGRLIFYLIADNSIKTILDPILINQSIPIHKDNTTPIFTRSIETTKGPTDLYTVTRLLQRQENTGYKSAQQVPGLSLTLKPYQLQSLQWMLDQEASERGLNWKFWEEFKFADGGSFYYSSILGELRLERPTLVRGGLLTEEMGLGKTLECIGLILATKYPTLEELNRRSKLQMIVSKTSPKISSNTTLIIVPDPLISQWQSEVKKSLTDNSLLSVVTYVHRGTKRNSEREEKEFIRLREAFDKHGTKLLEATVALNAFQEIGLKLSVEELEELSCGSSTHRELNFKMFQVVYDRAKLSRADIVLTTFGTVSKDSTSRVMEMIGWKRIMIDEMQFMRSPTSAMARATRKLHAQFRWMISGTPIYTDLNDLNGELQFLGVIPFLFR